MVTPPQTVEFAPIRTFPSSVIGAARFQCRGCAAPGRWHDRAGKAYAGAIKAPAAAFPVRWERLRLYSRSTAALHGSVPPWGVFIAAYVGGRAFHNIESVHRVCPFHTMFPQRIIPRFRIIKNMCRRPQPNISRGFSSLTNRNDTLLKILQIDSLRFFL